jgi:hypothetical protein
MEMNHLALKSGVLHPHFPIKQNEMKKEKRQRLVRGGPAGETAVLRGELGRRCGSKG